jgi:hypothetical protein
MAFTPRQVQALREFILAIPPGPTCYSHDGGLTASGTAKRVLLWLIDRSEGLTKPFHFSVEPYRYGSGNPSTMEQYYFAEASNLAWCLGAMNPKPDTPFARIFGEDAPGIWGTLLTSQLVHAREPEDQWIMGYVNDSEDKVEPQSLNLDEIDAIELPVDPYYKLIERTLLEKLADSSAVREQQKAVARALSPRSAVRIPLPPPRFTHKEIADLRRLIIGIPTAEYTGFTQDRQLVATERSKKMLLRVIDGSEDLTRAFGISVPAHRPWEAEPLTLEQRVLKNAISLAFLLRTVPGAPVRTLEKLHAHLDTRDDDRDDRWHFGFFMHMQDDIAEHPFDLAVIDATSLEL